MNVSTDNILAKAEARLLFHKAEAEKHNAAATKIENSIAGLKTLIEELDGDFDVPQLESSEPVDVAQLVPPASRKPETSQRSKLPTKRSQEQQGGPTIAQRVRSLHLQSPELSVKQAAEQLGLTERQVVNSAYRQDLTFGQRKAEPDDKQHATSDSVEEPEVDNPVPAAPETADEDEIEAPPPPINGSHVPRVPIPTHQPAGKLAAGTKFYLQDKDTGKYLHEDLNAMIMKKGELHLVDRRDHAWCNTESKLLNVRRALPDTMDLVEVPVIE